MSLKIVAISDTHQLHNKIKLPEGDVLVHCGDFTNKGTDGAIKEFLTWFSTQPHEYKVFIAGNHELGLDMGPNRAKKLDIIKEFTSKDPKMTYLENSEVTINGIKFYGSPITPWFFNWAWNVRRGAPIAAAWDLIPDDTQVLLTHGPAYGILDLVTESYGRDVHQGCQDLKKRIDNLSSLKLHVCGHLHLQGGHKTVVDGKIFVNAVIDL
jgi:Icc-related predicted phosphoesterase